MSEINFWDIIATQETLDYSQVDSIEQTLRECQDIAMPHIQSLQHISANAIYLNIIHNVSQSVIADIFNVSQYAISKRVAQGLGKLKVKLKKPEQDLTIAYKELSLLFNSQNLAEVMCYYIFNNSYIVSAIFGEYSGDKKKQIKFYSDIIDQASENPLIVLQGHKTQNNIDKLAYKKVLSNTQKIKEIANKYKGFFTYCLENETFGDFINKANSND